MAAKGLYLKIPAGTSHVVSLKKTRNLQGEGPHVSVSERCHIFKLESPLGLLLRCYSCLVIGKLTFKDLPESRGIVWPNPSSHSDLQRNSNPA